MRGAIVEALNEARAARRAVALLRDFARGEDLLLDDVDEAPTGFAAAVASALRSGRSGMVEGEDGGGQRFLMVQVPPPRIVAIGAVHITQALAPLAAIAGYDIEIIDPRTAFATPERFTGTRLFAEWPETVLEARPLDAYTALAAVTHDPKIDDPALAAALRAGCFYIGALGSRKTHAKRVERLRALGIAEESVTAIRAPIGVDIAAATPAEIAVAILAEIVGAFRKRGVAGQDSKGPPA